MKKTKEIIGLPIISISDGMEVGKVKSIIINASKGAIDYIVVESGIQILGARVIPTDNILGVGDYAVTIENENSINDISKIPAAIDLLQQNIQVKGTKVLTKKGRLIGEIGDIYVNEDENCLILGLEYIADITQKRIRLIPRDSVITFGKNLVVVKDDVEYTLVDDVSLLESQEKPGEVEKKNLMGSASDETIKDEGALAKNENSEMKKEIAQADRVIAADSEEYIKQKDTQKVLESVELTNEHPSEEAQMHEEAPLVEEPKLEEGLQSQQEDPEIQEQPPQVKNDSQSSKEDQENDKEQDKDNNDSRMQTSAADLFEQKQRQYLKGRKATKVITDTKGNVIAEDGTLIDDDIINRAKKSGKLIELVMNNKA